MTNNNHKINKQHFQIRQICFWIYTLFFSLQIQAQFPNQKQTAFWAIGNMQALDFNTGNAIPGTSSMQGQNEGLASLSDENGNLLFYTSGFRVWDSSHNYMQNGLGLYGDYSVTQSAVIIPHPGNCNLFYLFTIDLREAQVPNFRTYRGLRYNLIDMRLNNGLGAIVPGQKNISISDLPFYEKMTAIPNASRSGYWIITYFGNSFYAYEITDEGINLEPVISEVSGTVLNNYIGAIKSSSNGSKIALCNIGSYEQYNGSLSIYDFNNSSGIVSNEIFLHYPTPNEENSREFYSAEFSINGRFLYTTEIQRFSPTSANNNVVQYDLSASNIISSKQIIGNNSLRIEGGTFQMAMDGNIYIGSSTIPENPAGTYIARIENTEELYDSANGSGPIFNENAILLSSSSNMMGYGLPQFHYSYFHTTLFINDEDTTSGTFCPYNDIAFGYCGQGAIVTGVHWDFGDGNMSNEEAPVHFYKEPGIYTVTITWIADGQEVIRTMNITITGPATEDAVLQTCFTNEPYTFDLAEAVSQINPNNENVSISFFETQEEALNNENPITSFTTDTNTTVFARITDENGCYVIRMVELQFNNELLIETEEQIVICTGTSTLLTATASEDAIIRWYNTETNPFFTGNNYQTPLLDSETSYWVEAYHPESGCVSERIEIQISIQELGAVTVAFTYENEICKSQDYAFPLFSTGFNEGGTFSTNNPMELDVDETTGVINVQNSKAGVYLVRYELPRDENNCLMEDSYEISVAIAICDIPKGISPNGDGLNDFLDLTGMDIQELKIYNRYGQEVFSKTDYVNEFYGQDKNGNELPEGTYYYVIYRYNGLQHTGWIYIRREMQ